MRAFPMDEVSPGGAPAKRAPGMLLCSEGRSCSAVCLLLS